MSCSRRSDAPVIVHIESCRLRHRIRQQKNDASGKLLQSCPQHALKAENKQPYKWYVLSKKSREKEQFRISITRPIFLHSLSHFSDSKILDACCIRAPPLLLVDLVTYVLLTAATTSTDTNHHNNNEATK